MKTCSKCGREFPATSEYFHPKTRATGKLRAECKDCIRLQRRAWRAANPGKHLAARARYRFGVTLEEMIARHGGECMICRKEWDGTGRRHSIDHDHACCPGTKTCGNCVRGLLCSNCNKALGFFSDDPALLQAAIKYLSDSKLRTREDAA